MDPETFSDLRIDDPPLVRGLPTCVQGPVEIQPTSVVLLARMKPPQMRPSQGPVDHPLIVVLQTCRGPVGSACKLEVGSSGKHNEAVLPEVPVVGKSVLDGLDLHQSETGAVGKAVRFVLVGPKDFPRLLRVPSFYP